MQKKKKRSQHKWFWRIGCGLATCGTILTIIVTVGIFSIYTLAQGLSTFGGSNSSCGTDDTAPFEGYARITLPENVTNFTSNCGGFQGWWAEAKFDIVPDDLEQFLNTTNIDYPLTITELPAPIYVPFKQEVLSLDNLLYGVSDEREWLEEIVVDTTHTDHWTVYFVVLAG